MAANAKLGKAAISAALHRDQANVANHPLSHSQDANAELCKLMPGRLRMTTALPLFRSGFSLLLADHCKCKEFASNGLLFAFLAAAAIRTDGIMLLRMILMSRIIHIMLPAVQPIIESSVLMDLRNPTVTLAAFSDSYFLLAFSKRSN